MAKSTDVIKINLNGDEDITIKEPENDKKVGFLDDESRTRIRNSIEEGGISTQGMTDEELLDKLQNEYTTVRKIKDELISSSEDKNTLALRLNSYLNTSDSLLTDKQFVSRLFAMGVPDCFLKLFRDADSTFTDAKIWEIIRHSGITVSDINIEEILSRRRGIPKSEKRLFNR